MPVIAREYWTPAVTPHIMRTSGVVPSGVEMNQNRAGEGRNAQSEGVHHGCRVTRLTSCKEAELGIELCPVPARDVGVSNEGHDNSGSEGSASAYSIPPRHLTVAVHKKVASLRAKPRNSHDLRLAHRPPRRVLTVSRYGCFAQRETRQIFARRPR